MTVRVLWNGSSWQALAPHIIREQVESRQQRKRGHRMLEIRDVPNGTLLPVVILRLNQTIFTPSAYKALHTTTWLTIGVLGRILRATDVQQKKRMIFHDRAEAHRMLESLCRNPIRADLCITTLEKATETMFETFDHADLRTPMGMTHVDASALLHDIGYSLLVSRVDRIDNLEYTLEKLDG